MKLGETYNSNKQAREFLWYIADNYHNQLVHLLGQSQFFSVMCDGATDSSMTEEIIYLQLLVDGKPTTKFLALKPVAKADAAGTMSAVIESLEIDAALNFGAWKSRLVGLGADGTAVMMGHRGGVVAKLKEEAPQVIEMHCCAYRLELAIKDSAVGDPYLKVMDEFL